MTHLDAALFGLRLQLAWTLRLHSGQTKEPIDLSTPEAREASPGIVGLLESAATLRLGGCA